MHLRSLRTHSMSGLPVHLQTQPCGNAVPETLHHSQHSTAQPTQHSQHSTANAACFQGALNYEFKFHLIAAMAPKRRPPVVLRGSRASLSNFIQTLDNQGEKQKCCGLLSSFIAHIRLRLAGSFLLLESCENQKCSYHTYNKKNKKCHNRAQVHETSVQRLPEVGVLQSQSLEATLLLQDFLAEMRWAEPKP